MQIKYQSLMLELTTGFNKMIISPAYNERRQISRIQNSSVIAVMDFEIRREQRPMHQKVMILCRYLEAHVQRVLKKHFSFRLLTVNKNMLLIFSFENQTSRGAVQHLDYEKCDLKNSMLKQEYNQNVSISIEKIASSHTYGILWSPDEFLNLSLFAHSTSAPN